MRLQCLLIPVVLLVVSENAQSLSSSSESRQIDGRIVGGYQTDIRDFPYIVALIRKRDMQQLCGGSIISDYWIVTAAHCMQHDPSAYFFRIGSTDKRKGGVIFNVGEYYNHPDYSIAADYDSDISLVKLNTPITVGTRGAIVNISSSDVKIKSSVTVAGWGRTMSIHQSSNFLRAVEVFIVEHAECKQNYSDKAMTVTDNMICAGYPGGSKDSCTGDSGGPLTFKGQLVGIVSFGYDCAHQKFPGVYTKINNFIPWIRNITNLYFYNS